MIDTSSHYHILILGIQQQRPSLIRSVACLVHILIFDRRAEGAFHLGGVAAQWGAAILQGQCSNWDERTTKHWVSKKHGRTPFKQNQNTSVRKA